LGGMMSSLAGLKTKQPLQSPKSRTNGASNENRAAIKGQANIEQKTKKICPV